MHRPATPLHGVHTRLPVLPPPALKLALPPCVAACSSLACCCCCCPARLRERDEARTKKAAGWKEGSKDKQRRAMGEALEGGEAEPGQLVPMLRDVSRQEYLKKREDAKLQELKDELEDAKYLFEGVQLTAREQADLAYKQRVYDLAVQRRQALEAVVDDGYSMPTNYGKTGPGLVWPAVLICLLWCGCGLLRVVRGVPAVLLSARHWHLPRVCMPLLLPLTDKTTRRR
eukprot:GHRQ01021343.1.p1 GENE.GHRQ01021343.1~~GHRQ01021343.1.p1  ORF type:complete len:229 (+),score=78.39 GHRQ01021343.1:333-1019(+)